MNYEYLGFTIVIAIIVGAFAYKAGTKIAAAKKTEDLKDDEQAKKDILNDFLFLLSSIALKSIEIIGKKDSLTEEDYKKYIAEEIVEEFDANILPTFKDTITGKILEVITEEEKINFVLNNVLTQSSIKEKIDSIINGVKSKTEEVIDASSLKDVKYDDYVIPTETKESEISKNINKYDE